MAGYWAGADPGGKGKFGLAFLYCDGEISCTRVSSVDEAVEAIADKGEPCALGVDAPMWWSSGVGGGRKSDEILRKAYGIHPGTVQSVNSLRGAALVGGTLLAFRVRERFPSVKVTEAHPKALLRALDLKRNNFPGEFGLSCGSSDNEDEQDAAIAAVCARQAFTGEWTTDLADERFRHKSEQDPKCYWLAPMHYYWPEDFAPFSLQGSE